MSAPDLTAAPDVAAPARYGEVYDRGYRHYDGPRLGRVSALWALVRYSMKRALGIKKGVGAKIIPILLYVGVLLPAFISLGIRAFVPDANILDYDDYFEFIFIIEGIFVATIAPEMLCGDRRENVLALYFSRAITRADYLLAKLLATAILVLTVSLIPAAILWLGRQLLLDDPLAGMADNLGDLGRIVIAGTLIAFYLGAIGLVISSFTGRKSIAVGIIAVGFLVANGLGVALFENLEGDGRRYAVFLSPNVTTGEFGNRLFDQAETLLGTATPFDAWVYAAVMGAIVAASCAIMFLRYVPDE